MHVDFEFKCKNANGSQGDGTQSGTCASDSVCKADGSCSLSPGTKISLILELATYKIKLIMRKRLISRIILKLI